MSLRNFITAGSTSSLDHSPAGRGGDRDRAQATDHQQAGARYHFTRYGSWAAARQANFGSWWAENFTSAVARVS